MIQRRSLIRVAAPLAAAIALPRFAHAQGAY